MSFSAVQLRKEARQLLLPWTVTMLAGFLSLVRFSRSDYSWSPIDLLDWILPLGCFIAIPLLAALPLGTEFQQGTITFLLAQPMDRQKLWLKNTTITIAAVLPAAVLYLFSLKRNHGFDLDFWLAAVWIVASTAGSIAGTLITRSAIGGLALSSAFYGALFAVWSRLADSRRHNGDLAPAFLWITAAVLVCYAAGMVLLGRRMFLRFQPVEGMHGAALPLAETRFLPQIATNWLRARPRRPILNLIRREFRLLRTVWLLSLLSLVTWTSLVLFHFVGPTVSGRTPMPAGLAVVLSLVMALLAGSLSLGEEKSWGTHSWQLTMPLSTSVQWLTKVIFALGTSVVCAVAIPFGVLMTYGSISGVAFSDLDRTPFWVWLVGALGATLLAFWCSSVVKGTVRSVVWFFPLLIAIGLSGQIGTWAGQRALSLARPLVDALLSKLDPFRTNHQIVSVLDPINDFLPVFALIFAPLLAVILIQSHRQFRAKTQDTNLYALRSAIPSLATLLSSTFLINVIFLTEGRLREEELNVVTETHFAIESLESDKSTENADRVRKFTLGDLAKAASLSDTTLHWLRGSTIVVRRDPIHPAGSLPPIQWPYESAFLVSRAPGKQAVSYAATIHTPRGSECNLGFTAGPNQKGFLFHSCQ